MTFAALPMAHTSQVEGRLRAVLEKTLRRGGVARPGAVVAMLVMLLFVVCLTAFRLVYHTPATLSALTSAAQDGFALLAVQRGDIPSSTLTVNTPQGAVQRYDNGAGGIYEVSPDATILWIQPPPLPHATVAMLLNEYHVTCRGSSGTTFRLPYCLADDGRPPYYLPQLVCIALPAGYPNTDRYFDVTVSDRHGHHARWRVTHLPTMKHLLAHPHIQAQETTQGFVVQAAAWRTVDPGPGYSSAIMEGLHIESTPATLAHHWEVETFNPIMEWVSQSPDSVNSTETMPIGFDAPRDGWMTPQWETPYAADIHYAGLNANLRQYEIYDEPVTFHNVMLRTVQGNPTMRRCAVTAAQSVTTPSGITVTLPSQNNFMSLSSEAHTIVCEFSFTGGNHPKLLPISPLCRRYHRPVTVQIVLPKPDAVVTSGSSGQLHTLNFTFPKPYPTHLKNFTVIVRQRVDLQVLPLHFVVPVGKSPLKSR